MITNLQVKNYRSLADVNVDFEPLTVLVGPNGSGKSNLVDALRFVADALQRGLDVAIGKRNGISALRRWSAKGRPYDVEIKLSFKTEGLEGEYLFILGSERRGEYSVKVERCQIRTPDRTVSGFEVNKGEWIALPLALPSGTNLAIQPTALILPLLTGLPLFKSLYDFLTNMSFYNIPPNQLTEPQKPANPYPLDEHGENLATVLRELKRDRNTAFTDLERALSRVMEDVQGCLVAQVGGYLVTKLHHAAVEESERGPLFELSQESDGTLRMLGILTALYQEPPRTLITLEEPELTIHPGAMHLLWEEIERASERSQILITTHSPDLLDMCRAEQLCVVEKIDGVTHIGPIAEEQKQAIQKRLFAPGQLLQAQGLWRAVET